jgi:hypothetical protein
MLVSEEAKAQKRGITRMSGKTFADKISIFILQLHTQFHLLFIYSVLLFFTFQYLIYRAT